MDFEFREEQKIFRKALETVVEREIEPLLASYPEDKPLPKETIIKAMQIVKPLGLLGARVPLEDGGSGLGAVGLGIASEILPLKAHECYGTNESQAARISMGGSPELKRRFLPPILEGEKVASNATSEPNVGSDVGAIETRAVLDGDYYILNGTKLLASKGSVCDILVIVASIGYTKDGRNILSRFVVERDVSPFESRDVELWAVPSEIISEVVLNNARIPKENLLGEPGDALTSQSALWLAQRPLVGLRAVCLAQKAFETSIAYAQQRRQFGKTIGSFQLVQDMIVEMATLIEASRLLCYKALWLADKGEWCRKESSIAKQFACESAVRATSLAVEVHGAIGISKECKVWKYFRDAMAQNPQDGTRQINKLIAGREILGMSGIR